MRRRQESSAFRWRSTFYGKQRVAARWRTLRRGDQRANPRPQVRRLAASRVGNRLIRNAPVATATQSVRRKLSCRGDTGRPSGISSVTVSDLAERRVVKCRACNTSRFKCGRLAERLKAPVLKTGRGASSSRVRISHLPPNLRRPRFRNSTDPRYIRFRVSARAQEDDARLGEARRCVAPGCQGHPPAR